MTALATQSPPQSVHASPVGRSASPGEYLTFRLGGEGYGIALAAIQEIRGYQPPTRIAGAPADVCGVLNLRGEIVPVVDLRLRFGLPAHVDASTVIVVVNVRAGTVGVVVDSVADAIDLASRDLRPAPALGGAAHVEYITGIAVVERDAASQLFILLDIEHLVSDATLQPELTAAAA